MITKRTPTGKPSWPLILLASVDGGGKGWAAAEATSSDLFGSSFWVQVGEQTADEYGGIPGARFEIYEHDGSFTQILESVRQAAAEPVIDEKPNLLIVDTMTEIWDLVTAEQQVIANKRRGNSAKDAQITTDMWSTAKRRWGYVVSTMRAFPGPVIMTARLEQLTASGSDGRPIAEPTWKIRVEKNLPHEVQVVVQARTPRDWVLTKIANRTLQMPEQGYLELPDFTIADLLSRMGLEDVAPSPYVYLDPSRIVGEADRARAQLKAVLDAAKVDPAEAVKMFSACGHGDLGTSEDVVSINQIAAYYESAAVPA